MNKTHIDLGELFIPASALLFAVYYISTVLGTPWEARAYPTVLTAGMIVCAAAVFIGSLVKKSEGAFSSPSLRMPHRKSVILFITSCLYVALMPVLGYLVSSLLFLIASLRKLGVTDKKLFIGLSVITGLVMYILFVMFMDMHLPGGFLPVPGEWF
ncbi:MAG: Tripartite tricarboxylate transporter TctB family [Clostridia bacterium]|nr:Tripartite tricarboxylate transporter TctB family [Clostridia bacterium]